MADEQIIAKTDQRAFTLIYDDFLKSNLLDYYEKMIFITLKSYTDNKTKQAFPSLKTISSVTGISYSKVRKCLSHMKELGVIKSERRFDKKGGETSKLYTLYDYADVWNTGKLPEDFDDLEEERQLVERLKRKGYIITKKKDSEKSSTTTISQSHQTSNAVSNIASNLSNTHNTQMIQKSQETQERYPEQWIIDFYNLNELKEENPTKAAVVDTVANILYTILNSTKETIRVNGEDKPTMAVVGRMLKLNQDMILYAIDQFIGQTDKIKNPRSYMITCLYNAQEQYELALNNQVSHDLAHYED